MAHKVVKLFKSAHSRYGAPNVALIALNSIYLVLGAISLTIGVWLYATKHDYEAITPAHHGAASATGLSIAAGAAIVVVALIGCSATVLEHSKKLLLTYIVGVAIILTVELCAGTLSLAYEQDVKEHLYVEMYATLHYKQNHVYTRHTWDRLQTDFRCCGVSNYTDWHESPRFEKDSESNRVPDSCCIDDNCDVEENLYKQGCFWGFREWLSEHVHIIGVMGISLALYQTAIICIAAWVYWRMNQAIPLPVDDNNDDL